MFGWRVIPRIGFDEFSLSPHGLGIALGYFAGAILLARRARSRGFDEDQAWNGAAFGVIGAILGARVAYILGHYNEFSSPAEWLRIWEGGISLVGGLLGAFLTVFIYTRVRKIAFFELMDLGAPGLAIGVAIGRIGDLVIGDHLGKETSGWWGWEYRGGELISAPYRLNAFGLCVNAAGERAYSTLDGCMAPGIVVHQTALYDMMWSVALLAILLYLDRRPRNRGFAFLWWATLYGLGRVVTDFARVDKTWLGTGLTGSQLTSIVAVALCLFFLIRYRGVPRRAQPPVETWVEPPPAGEGYVDVPISDDR